MTVAPPSTRNGVRVAQNMPWRTLRRDSCMLGRYKESVRQLSGKQREERMEGQPAAKTETAVVTQIGGFFSQTNSLNAHAVPRSYRS